MFNFIKLLFFPVFCEGCGLLGKSICDKCLMKTHIIKDKQCHNCSQILSTKNTANDKNKYRKFGRLSFIQTSNSTIYIVLD
jgi:hypothetical protein